MNKRTITIDQLIREEYLKLQKEKYIKNLIKEVAAEIQEQQNRTVADDLAARLADRGIDIDAYRTALAKKPEPITGGRIRDILIPILEKAGFNAKYESSNRSFSPISRNTDPLYKYFQNFTFADKFAGIRFQQTPLDIGNSLQNMMLGLKFQSAAQQIEFDKNGLPNSIRINTNNISFDISNLPKKLNSLAGSKNFSKEELENGYILSPNGSYANITLKFSFPKIPSINTVDTPSISLPKSRNIPSFSETLKDSNWKLSKGMGVLKVKTSRTTNNDGKNVERQITYGVANFYTDPIIVENQHGVKVELSINIVGPILKTRAIEADGSLDPSKDKRKDSKLNKLFPSLVPIANEKFVPGPDGLTTPDAILEAADLSSSQITELENLRKLFETDPIFESLMVEMIKERMPWALNAITKAFFGSIDFILWCITWLALYNPITSLVFNPNIDNLQYLFDWMGWIDAYFIGTGIDIVNAIISFSRYYLEDKNNRFIVDGCISLFAAIPVYGWAGALFKYRSPLKQSRLARKALEKVTPKGANLVKLVDDKLFDQFTKAVAAQDISKMSKILQKMIKKGLLDGDVISKMKGDDCLKAAALLVASAKKNLNQFAKYLEKINSALPTSKQIDIDWAFNALNKSEDIILSMNKGFQDAYNKIIEQQAKISIPKVIIKKTAKGTKFILKKGVQLVAKAATWSGIWTITGSLPKFIVFNFFKNIVKKIINPKWWSERKAIDLGKNAAEFMRKMWYQHLYENTGKLALLFNRNADYTVKLLNEKMLASFSRYSDSGKATFIDIYNKIVKEKFTKITDIPKTDLDYFLTKLKNGSYKIKGINRQSQQSIFREIAQGVAAVTSENKTPLFVAFMKDGFQNLFNPFSKNHLSKYWTKEAIDQKGYKTLINGIFSMKFADIAFDELNVFFEKEGLNIWGTANESEKVEIVQGFFVKFIYDTFEKFDPPIEETLRIIKNHAVDKLEGAWTNFQINQELIINDVKNNTEELSDEFIKKINQQYTDTPGLEGDYDDIENSRLISPFNIMLEGGVLITNPWIRPRYTGPDNRDEETWADTGRDIKIGNNWHTGDGKTGKPMKYWKANQTGIPYHILRKALQYTKDTPLEQIAIPLSIKQTTAIAKTTFKNSPEYKEAQQLIAKEIEELTNINLISSYRSGAQIERIWKPGPPTANQVVNFLRQQPGFFEENMQWLATAFDMNKKELDKILNYRKKELSEQDFSGPFGKEHDYSDYGGPWGTGHHHKTKFKKGPGKNPTDSISSDRGEEEAEDDRITGYQLVSEDPKKGTGKKPKGSGRRLYTDENPKDTVSVKFKTRQNVSDTLNKSSFKSKSHKRQSQIINLIHQRLRVAVERTKDPEKKKRLKAAYDYIEKKKEASKEKTKRLNKENFADGKNPGRKGLSQRVGIPKNATIAQLEKAAKSDGEKGRLARWQLNMRRGKKK